MKKGLVLPLLLASLAAQAQEVREFPFKGMTCFEESIAGMPGQPADKHAYCGDKESGRLDVYAELNYDSLFKDRGFSSRTCIYDIAELQRKANRPYVPSNDQRFNNYLAMMYNCSAPYSSMVKNTAERSSPRGRQLTEKFRSFIKNSSEK